MKSSRRIAWFFVSFLFVSALAVPPILAQAPFVPRHLGPALAAQARYTKNLLRIEGVAGTAVGLGENGAPVVKIYTEREGVGGLPQALDGVSVVVQVTGKIHPIKPPPGKGGGHGGGVDPKAEFTPPVPLGVSSGNDQVEIVGLFITCSSGTLGARLKSNGVNYYILSNNHVYARTNSSGSTDKIVQPGLADTGCSSSGNIIGNNIQYIPIKFIEDDPNSTNVVDAAVASTSTTQVGDQFWDTDHTIPGQNAYALTADDIGSLGVRKFGATSGLTVGRVTGWNATFLISYGTNETAQFTHQIEFSGCKGGCIKGGDSGSVLIRSDDSRPVGLLFAGDNSGKTAWANPMTDPEKGINGVLSELNALLRSSSLTFE